jgi:hypothetical protein
MNIPLVKVFTPTPIGMLSAGELVIGIEKRLKRLTYLFCPEKELPPDSVLETLKVESNSNGDLLIRWRPRMKYPPRVYEFGPELESQLATTRCGIKHLCQNEPHQEAIRILDECTDGAGFFQGYARDDMGWPVVMAAAATIVERAGGAIVTNGLGWYVPDDNDLTCIFRPSSKEDA